jgi:hypothetical protein
VSGLWETPTEHGCGLNKKRAYNGTNIPDYWVGNGSSATGTIYVAYALHLVTNSITWGRVSTNIVGVSTQLQYYSAIGNLTNIVTLP